MERRTFLQASAAAGATIVSKSSSSGAESADSRHAIDDPAAAITGVDGRVVHADVEFHGVSELLPVKGYPGLRLQRIPESVRLAINSKAASRMLAPDGAEIRFVSKSPEIEVTLSSPSGDCDLIAFWGGFQDIERHSIGPQPKTVRFVYPERLAQLKAEFRRGYAFSPDVWRLTLMGKRKDATVHFHEIRGEGLRPPKLEELPSITYLAYGTSITDGFTATAMHLTYIAQAARRLNADYVNLGCAGSAYCEPEFADYMAARRDWHVATLCISLNMIGAEFSEDEFRRRAGYMLNTMAAADARRPVMCISILPFFGDFCDGIQGPHGKGRTPGYRQALRDLVQNSRHRNVHLVEGSDLLRHIDGLSMDLAHPGDCGMIEIGANLASKIEPLLAASREGRG